MKMLNINTKSVIIIKRINNAIRYYLCVWQKMHTIAQRGVGTKFLLFVYTATKFSINKQLAFILAYKTIL